jgi:ferredoxin
MYVVVNPTIDIDRKRCTTPFDCKRCLRQCPTAVFSVYAIKNERGLETDKTVPGNYVLAVSYRDQCTGCMKCVEICPVDALKVEMPQEASA